MSWNANNTNKADPEIVNKLEKILENGKNNKTDPDALALKVTLKAIELLSIP